MADTREVNWLGLIGLIGSVLMIVGVFLSWVDVQIGSGIISYSESYSGWTTYSDGIGDYSYAALVTLIAGILALITTIIPIVPNVFKSDKVNKLLGVLSLILAVVAVVLIVLYNGQMESISIAGITIASASAGIGLWIALAGSVVLAVGGIVDIVKKYVPKTADE